MGKSGGCDEWMKKSAKKDALDREKRTLEKQRKEFNGKANSPIHIFVWEASALDLDYWVGSYPKGRAKRFVVDLGVYMTKQEFERRIEKAFGDLKPKEVTT